MSRVINESESWKAIMADPELARARSKLSFHEIRLIMKHARNTGCPICITRPTYEDELARSFCEKHRRQYAATFPASGMPLSENNEDCSRPEAGSPAAKPDAHNA